jgi:PAS domain S-box-containing protein
MLGWVQGTFSRIGVRKAVRPSSHDRDLELANEALRIEIGKREGAEEETRRVNFELEERVHARTAELVEINAQLIRLAAVVRDSSESIWTVGLDGRIISWNLAAEQLCGHRAAEVLGQPVSMLAPAGLAGEMDEILERLQEGRNVGSFETTRIRKSGESFRALLTPSPIKSEAGEVLGASVLVRDITDHTRAQELFRLAVDAAPNAMIMADAHGKIVLVNAQTEKLFGYGRAEMIGQAVEMLLPVTLQDMHETYRREFMKAPAVRPMGAGRDLRGVRKDGTEVPIEVALNPIETAQGAFVLSAIVDITQRKKAEAEIKRLTQGLERRVGERTAELTTANADLESFSYSVAHDLRAPLRQIAGFSKILVEECGQEISPAAHRHLQKIQDGAQLMGCLVDDLLNLAKLHRQALDRRPVSLSDLTAKVVEELKQECEGREVEWRSAMDHRMRCGARAAGLRESSFECAQVYPWPRSRRD